MPDNAAPAGDGVRDRRRADRFIGLAEALIDQAPVGLLVLDTELRMVEVNPAMAVLNGRLRTELLGRSVRELLASDSLIEPILREVLKTGQPRLNVELQGTPPATPDEERTWLASYYPLRGPDRVLVGVGCLVLDITERTRAEQLAQAAAARLALLAQASEVLGASLDVAATLQGLVDLTVPAFADLAVLDLVDDSGSLRRHSTVTGKTDSSRRPPGRGQAVPYPSGHPARRVLADHRSLLVPSLAAMEKGALSPDLDVAAGIRLLGLHSLVAVPLLGHEEVLGVATFGRGTGQRPFDADDLALAEEIAVRAAVAVEHAARFSREREIAITLQRSLLPAHLPEIAGLDVAWRYLPGTAGTEVGGDWFDLIPLPAGRVGIVVGDVMGRGVRAAAIMGQLRAAVRAYAALDLPPNEVMARMDDLVQGLEPPEQGQLVTCVYVTYDPGLRRCCLANAGHLPPMVAARDGARMVTEASAAPLGVGGVPFTAAEIELHPGETLVLYTDGLIEHRGRDLDAGMDALRGLLRPVEGDLAGACDEILDALRPDPDYDDDVALALLRVPYDDESRADELELPAGPRAAAAARRFAAGTLAGWSLHRAAELSELLVSELVSNAVRHTTGMIAVRLRQAGGAVYVEVSDNDTRVPRLRTTGDDDESGRGLQLISELSRRWGVRPIPDGKVVWFELDAG